jgi:hypothetical protein
VTFRLADLLRRGQLDAAVQRHRQCGDKAGYRDRESALAALQSSLQRSDTCEDGERLNEYECRLCGLWHLGHRSHGQRKARKRRRTS